MKNILVPVDGSTFAEHALALASGLALGSGATLQLAMVHAPPTAELRDLVRNSEFRMILADAEETYLEDLARRVRRAAGANVETRILTGEVVRALTAFIADADIDLVVMSTHGRGGPRRLWLGSVADALLRRVQVPVLLVRPHEEEAVADLRPARLERMLLALDGSSAAEAVLPAVREICGLFDAECVLLRVVVPPMHPVVPGVPDTSHYFSEYVDAGRHAAERYLASIAKEFPAARRREVVVDHMPASAILRVAEEDGANLIAVGTRGAGAIGRMLIGSVADKVVRGSTLPVLVCHTGMSGNRHGARRAQARGAREHV